MTDNAHNLYVNDSFLSICAIRGYYSQSFDSTHTWEVTGYDPTTHRIDTHDTDSTVNYIITRPFTEGSVSPFRYFSYGYIEARIRLPDNYYPDIFGYYWDNAFYLYNTSSADSIDWSELDFEMVNSSLDTTDGVSACP